MEKTSSLKDLILNDTLLLYCLFGIILSAIYGIILTPIINVPIKCIYNASIDYKIFMAVAEQKKISDFLKHIVPFSIMCSSFLFLFIQHHSLDRTLTYLEIAEKQGGLLKLSLLKVLPWVCFLILALFASIWLPFSLHSWSAVLLIFIIITSIFLGVNMIMAIRMRLYVPIVIVVTFFGALCVMIVAYFFL